MSSWKEKKFVQKMSTEYFLLCNINCIPWLVQNLISPFYWLLTNKKKIIVCKSRQKRTFDKIVCFEPRGSDIWRVKLVEKKIQKKTDIW